MGEYVRTTTNCYHVNNYMIENNLNYTYIEFSYSDDPEISYRRDDVCVLNTIERDIYAVLLVVFILGKIFYNYMLSIAEPQSNGQLLTDYSYGYFISYMLFYLIFGSMIISLNLRFPCCYNSQTAFVGGSIVGYISLLIILVSYRNYAKNSKEENKQEMA